MLKRVLIVIAVLLVVVPLGLAGYVWYLLQPRVQDLPLPESLVSAQAPAGLVLLEGAEYTADYAPLTDVYQSQALGSYCGVASGVMMINALGGDSSQSAFFSEATDTVRTRMQVTLGGMSLVDLSGLLSAHGLTVQALHGDQLSLDEFRDLLARNLATGGDYLLVNYQREVLGQGRVGHISPVAAYNAGADKVLILDTASYKYPFTWVPVDRLYAAMQEHDGTTGKPRGLVEVRLPGA